MVFNFKIGFPPTGYFEYINVRLWSPQYLVLVTPKKSLLSVQKKSLVHKFFYFHFINVTKAIN